MFRCTEDHSRPVPGDPPPLLCQALCQCYTYEPCHLQESLASQESADITRKLVLEKLSSLFERYCPETKAHSVFRAGPQRPLKPVLPKGCRNKLNFNLSSREKKAKGQQRSWRKPETVLILGSNTTRHSPLSLLKGTRWPDGGSVPTHGQGASLEPRLPLNPSFTTFLGRLIFPSLRYCLYGFS